MRERNKDPSPKPSPTPRNRNSGPQLSDKSIKSEGSVPYTPSFGGVKPGSAVPGIHSTPMSASSSFLAGTTCSSSPPSPMLSARPSVGGGLATQTDSPRTEKDRTYRSPSPDPQNLQQTNLPPPLSQKKERRKSPGRKREASKSSPREVGNESKRWSEVQVRREGEGGGREGGREKGGLRPKPVGLSDSGVISGF